MFLYQRWGRVREGFLCILSIGSRLNKKVSCFQIVFGDISLQLNKSFLVFLRSFLEKNNGKFLVFSSLSGTNLIVSENLMKDFYVRKSLSSHYESLKPKREIGLKNENVGKKVWFDLKPYFQKPPFLMLFLCLKLFSNL